MHPLYHMALCCFFLLFFPVAKSDQINQSNKFSLLSQLALTSQNKFFLKNPPKSRKKAEPDAAAEPADGDLSPDLETETDSCEGLSPTSQYENSQSPRLDCAISDLFSLDSRAEFDEGIFNEVGEIEARVFCTIQKLHAAPAENLFFYFSSPWDSLQMGFSRTQPQSVSLRGNHVKILILHPALWYNPH